MKKILQYSYKKSRLSIMLGAFLFLQAATSLISGAFLFNPLVDDSDITTTMINVANNPVAVQASILVDIFTAIGIIILGICLYQLLKKTDKLLASIGLGLYIFEATLLVVSKYVVFGFLGLSTLYLESPSIELANYGQIVLDLNGFIYSSHIIPFGIAAIIFYYLLFKSNSIPRWISLWGVITVSVVLIGVILGMYNVDVPFILLVPYVPFEFGAGIFILIKGLKVRKTEEQNH
ncbi:MAG: DUF4386 domain-containing protein [Tenericutes bacterium]|jgi:hypothetical protein|nr:DUF4386 domain-containing protein [Mycoplasmatota bacterium]